MKKIKEIKDKIDVLIDTMLEKKSVREELDSEIIELQERIRILKAKLNK